MLLLHLKNITVKYDRNSKFCLIESGFKKINRNLARCQKKYQIPKSAYTGFTIK